jgi:hypothetical protein
MRCLNCKREIPNTAKICMHCEAPVMEGPTEDELAAARDLLEQLPPDVFADLQRTVNDSATAEEFVNSIFVGDCPKCHSTSTGDCENDPEIGELLVGRCYDCGQLWCTECLALLTPEAPACPCWDEDLPDEDEIDDEDDEEGDDEEEI